MRFRMFAPLAVAAALAACSDPLVPDGSLTGRWVSDPEAVVSFFPDGQHTVQARVVANFNADGTFQLETRFHDTVLQRDYTDELEVGTFVASGGEAHLAITARYMRAAQSPSEAVTLQPVAYTRRYDYAVRDAELSFTPVCEDVIISSCIQPRFTHFLLSGIEG